MADTFTVSEESARAAYKEAGLSDTQIEKALAGLRNARVTAGIEAKVNPAGERKYGDVSIFKVQGNGYRKPAMGLFRGQIAGLIAQLQDALKVLDAEASKG